MQRKRLWLCAMIVAVISALPVSAAAPIPPVPGFAIAMHGTPKYQQDFKQFDYVNPDAPKGGTLKMGLVGTFDSLNPYIVRGNPAANLAYTTDTLMARAQDEPFTLYGLVAEKVALAPNRQSVTFYLRPEAAWQDGQPITAADVRFSWETLRDKGRPNHRNYYKKVVEAVQSGDHTITFKFEQDKNGRVDRELPLIIGLMPLLPKHYWQGKTFDDTTLTPPLGSGPYKIAAVTPGRQIIYQRDPAYWGRDLPVNKGLYNFDQIIVDYYRDDSVALEAFKAGAFDLRRESDPARWAAAYDSPALRIGDIVKEELPHQRVEPVKVLAFNLRRPLFQDVTLRQALIAAFDAGWINQTLYGNAYKRMTSYFGGTELAAKYFPDDYEQKLLQDYRYKLSDDVFNWTPATGRLIAKPLRERLAKAAQDLKAKGYKIVAGNLYTAANNPVAFEILINDPTDEKIALSYGQSLKQLGIKARIRTVDSTQYQARLNDFDYDMAMVRWVNSLSPGNEQWLYWGSAAADVKGSRNYTGLKNEVVDQMIARLLAATTRSELVSVSRALDRVLQASYLTIPQFMLGRDLVAHRARIMRPDVTPLYGYVLESWWDKTAVTAAPDKKNKRPPAAVSPFALPPSAPPVLEDLQPLKPKTDG